jgi:hypothetical protein
MQLGEVRLSRHRFSTEPLPWLAELDELLPVIVGAQRATSKIATSQTAAR